MVGCAQDVGFTSNPFFLFSVLVSLGPRCEFFQCTLYWYLWDNPQRDSRDGVLSVRVNLIYSPDESDEAMLEHAWEFIREMYPSTVPWDRF